MTAPPTVDTLTGQLCATLARLETALVRLETESLLTTEESLAALVDAMAAVNGVKAVNITPEQRDTLRQSIQRAQAALLRCRRLGASFTAVARVRLSRLTAHAGGDSYDRGGELQGPTVSGSSVQVAV